jgi:hypothetical protein
MFRRVIPALLVVAALSGAVLAYALSYAPGAAAAFAYSGKQVYPSQNLVTVAKNASAGSTFCIHDGWYKVNARACVVPVQSNKTIAILGHDGLIDTNTARHVIDVGRADNVTVRNLRVSGAVHFDACEPDCGRGIGGPGDNLTVINVRATDNENQGIGGTGRGLRIIRSVLDHNGSHDAAADGGKVSAAGLKAVNSIYVEDSFVHDNYWVGVWCDLECGRFEVHDSTIVRNGRAGIHDEISSGPALFEGNTIRGNGHVQGYNRRNGGLLVTSSRHVRARNNTFGDNVGPGVWVVDGRMPPKVDDVAVYENNLRNDLIIGCKLLAVKCYGN